MIKQTNKAQYELFYQLEKDNDKLLNEYIANLEVDENDDIKTNSKNTKNALKTYDEIEKNTNESYLEIWNTYPKLMNDVIDETFDSEFEKVNKLTNDKLPNQEINIDDDEFEKKIKANSSKGGVTDKKRFENDRDKVLEMYDGIIWGVFDE